jgi:transcriptional regulator with XRE-family HTH domain
MSCSLNLADLGRRVRTIRTGRRLTLEEVVSRTGFTVSWLSKLETGQLSPSLDGLVRLAEALECGVDELVAGLSVPPQMVVVRHGEGTRSTPKESRTAVHEELANGWRNRGMHPVIIHLVPGGRRHAPETRDGQRFLFVLEGQAQVAYGDDSITLTMGDCVYIDAAIPHVLRAAGNHPARLLSVACDTPPGRSPPGGPPATSFQRRLNGVGNPRARAPDSG